MFSGRSASIAVLLIISAILVRMLVFYLGLDAKGVFGPSWVIFLAVAWKLWKDRKAV
jgi:hypothetical protein